MRKITRQIKHYTPLFGILIAAFVGFWLFSFDRLFQTAIIVAAAIAYITWGIVNHSIHKDLTWEIVIEYMAVAAVGLIVVLSIIFRA